MDALVQATLMPAALVGYVVALLATICALVLAISGVMTFVVNRFATTKLMMEFARWHAKRRQDNQRDG